jgi:tetratricopeptide (TPR) repeat protein
LDVDVSLFLRNKRYPKDSERILKFIVLEYNKNKLFDLFEIDADPRLAGVKPFANITSISHFPSEEEVLFMPGSIYRLTDLVYEDTLCIIRMTLCNDNDRELESVFEYMKNQYGNGERNLLTLGAVLYDMGKFTEAEKCYRHILDDETCDDHVISTCYHAFGTLALERGDYDSSLEWNHKLLQICMQKQEIEKSSLAHCYNSIGVAYQKKDDYERALHSYSTALMIWKQVFDENHPKVAMCLNNLGAVYHTMKKYSEALECHRQALAIWEIHLPANCSDLGAAHNNIGCVYGCLSYFEDAMEHYNLALKIYQKSLPSNHAANAKTLENMGLVHYLRNEQREALFFYEKAATIYRHALPSTHPKLTKIEKDIQNV